VRLFVQLFGEKFGPQVYGILRADTRDGVEEAKQKLTQALEASARSW
jgi:hypothetical protein